MIRRKGDKIKISGGYQYYALTKGNSMQRFWHYGKQLAIKKLLPPEPNEIILDVGCGSGVITSFLGNYGAKVIGIDSNKEAIEFANRRFSRPNVEFKLGLVDEKIKFNLLFDKIYCLELIEHIHLNQAEAMLKIFYDILKPGGRVYLTTPNYRSIWPLIEFLIDNLKLVPRLTKEQHVEKYNNTKIRELFSKTDFKEKKITTSYIISAWLAPLSWGLAKKIFSYELKNPLSIGSILICIFKKPDKNNLIKRN